MSNPSLDYLHAQSRSSPDHQATWPKAQKPAVKYTKRFDSGVADVDTEDGEISLRHMAATTVPYGRVSEYDYAARASHLYEDLPVSKYAPASEESMRKERLGPEPHQESSWPSTVSQVSTTASHAAIVNNNTEARKRQNPLYDAIQKQHPNPPAPDASGGGAHKVSSQRVMFICVFAVTALIIALASLFIAIYILVTLPQDKYEEANQVHLARYDQLKADYQDLANKYSELASMLSYNPSDDNNPNVSLATKVAQNQIGIQGLKKNASVRQDAIETLEFQVMPIDDMKKTLLIHGTNLSTITHLLNRSSEDIASLNVQVAALKELVSNVSKMEGPQGPQGVGNLSACTYTNHSLTLRNAIEDAAATSWNPSKSEIQDAVVMSASCSVVGGKVASLESKPVSSTPNGLQYRCHCSGVDSQIPDRICYLHLWMCPRLS